ncbi:MAG: hypothetical protein AB9836_08370 [Aminipila sp.]
MESIREEVENALAEGKIEDILKGATQSKSRSTRKASGEAGVLSIVNAKTGARITVANTLLEQIGNPTELQVSYDKVKKAIIVGEQLNNENSYPIRKSGSKGVIYTKGLVDEITEAMGLDFSNRSSITFQEAEYLQDEQYAVAIIKIR